MVSKSKYVMFGLLSIVILCCILKKGKEGYTILGDNKFIKVGNAFRADECQNECEKDPRCKYVNRPSNLKSWDKGECWKSGLYEQHLTGVVDKGNFKKRMVTWENKNYVQPPESVYGGTSGGYRFKDRESAANHCKSKGMQLCTSSQMINNKGWGNKKGNKKVNVCNSGWTTDKRGWWVGYAKNGCGSKAQTWESWWRPSGSSAHCCTKGYLKV